MAVDVEGRVFDCRGIDYRSAANGDATVNRRYGAVTWLIGVGDEPTPAMVEAFRWWRAERWLPRYPGATEVVGHRDLHATDCPGDPAYALVRSGRLADTHVEDDMPLTAAEKDELVNRTAAKVVALLAGPDATYQVHVPGSKDLAVPTDALSGIWAAVASGRVDVEALAEALVRRLPAGAVTDQALLAEQLAEALARRLAD